jgi:hypothetical protein
MSIRLKVSMAFSKFNTTESFLAFSKFNTTVNFYRVSKFNTTVSFYGVSKFNTTVSSPQVSPVRSSLSPRSEALAMVAEANRLSLSEEDNLVDAILNEHEEVLLLARTFKGEICL